MKMLKLIVLLLAVCLGLLSYSQSGGDSTISNNSMIMDHSGVQKFIESHKMIVKRKPFSEGFRIQIYNGNNREDANRIKSEFYGKFPGMRCYLTYMQPYYKVRIGDYVDQESARGDLKKLARFYPSSFLVPDQIRRTGDNEDKDTKASK